jgi:1-aminocyclopropane-1-carboxylate deaminase/D-cysteine desulfhydrase-like pyridoxal-dependent ACC family enzyme
VIDFTPVEQHGDIQVKRDDLFEVAGVRGGKVRTCLAIAERVHRYGRPGIVTASARTSPQSVIVARIAKHLGIGARCHMPMGDYSDMMNLAKASGAEIVQHKAGYNTVIIKRAYDDAFDNGWILVPFGMECWEAVKQTRQQVANIDPEAKRIVVTVGSAMSVCGILWGLADFDLEGIEVLGVVVGADPTKRLDRYAPMGWRHRLTLIKPAQEYHEAAETTVFDGIDLDPYYESKCLSFLKPGDTFWNIGIRPSM